MKEMVDSFQKLAVAARDFRRHASYGSPQAVDMMSGKCLPHRYCGNDRGGIGNDDKRPEIIEAD